MTYYVVLTVTLFLSSLAFSQHPQPYQSDLESATIASIHHAIHTHQMTCHDLISTYMERIKKYNLSVKNRAPINAWSELNPSALTQAHQLDTTFQKTNKLSGSLHCIPIILKDNIDSFDTTTTSGSYALLGSQPVRDAFLVKQLRDAGAIILGKGGMDEFAWGVYGISSRSGRIGNAYNPEKNPGGSSGGPAAAISASFALLGIGTDNSGSVRIPAAFHGLVGLRPSAGLISQQGIFPMGNLDGTAGPMARSTKDIAVILDAIAKADPHDPKTLNIPREPTYTAFLNEDGLMNKRIGIVRHVNNINTFDNMPAHIEKTIRNATKDMEKMGATVIEVNLPLFDNDRQNNQAGEIQEVNEYLASFPSTRKSFRDICESNRTRNFGSISDCLDFIKHMPAKNSKSYQKAQALFDKNRRYVHRVMEKKHLDALLVPITTQGAATYDAMTINTWRAPVSSNSGLPSITINVGYTAKNTMPIGVELVGKQFHEGRLIEIAYAYERHKPNKMHPIMPEENRDLLPLSIPQLNNILTTLGKNAYQDVLIHTNVSSDVVADLTPERFRQITVDVIERLNGKKST